MKPVEIPLRLEFDHIAAIGTAISLQGQGVFLKIKKSINKPMPPEVISKVLDHTNYFLKLP